MMATPVMLRLSRYLLALSLALGCSLADASAARAETINWPIKPVSMPHPLGNSYGEYQYYGGSPYYHPGIDVMGSAGDSVFAVKAGYVKAVLTTSANLHWRVAVGDSAAPVWCDGYLYAHLNVMTIQVAVGDTVMEGQYLGQLVEWTVADFHHLHFVKIRQVGEPWSADWMFIHNPLDYLVSISDIWPPEFVTLANGSVAAFYPNNGATYYAPGDTLSGAVDFLVSVRDIVGAPEWYLTPYQVAYRFRNDSISYPSVVSVQFRDTLWWDQNVDVIYRDDAVYDSKGDYSDREYYVICTNTDGDEYIEAGDADSAWFTGDYPDGDYWLHLSVIDRHGNRDDESLLVVLHNPLTFRGTVTLADQPPSHAGTRVHLPELGLLDTTDATGAFAIADVGPGTYEVRVERSFYDSVYTTERLTLRDQVRHYTLQPVPGLRGDVDHDDDVDAADILLLVNYIFKSGPAPDPIESGDIDGVRPITSSDLIYLVNYVFKGGPPPPPL